MKVISYSNCDSKLLSIRETRLKTEIKTNVHTIEFIRTSEIFLKQTCVILKQPFYTLSYGMLPLQVSERKRDWGLKKFLFRGELTTTLAISL